MSIDKVNKLLAYSLVSKIMDVGKGDVKVPEMNFAEMETLYNFTLNSVENAPDIRERLVASLKSFYEKNGNLDDFYPTEKIAGDESLQEFLGNI